MNRTAPEDPERWRAILRALVETVMAFDHPDFPARSADQVERRVLEEFPPALRTTLLAFGETACFPFLDAAARQAEQALLVSEAVAASELDRIIADRAGVDQQRFEAFVRAFGAAVRFEEATLAGRRAYLRLWARSGLAARRRCYTTLKAVVLVPAYGLPELARAIGAPDC